MTRVLTGVVGAVIEAWQEVRIHKTRVLLSLIGVAVAVCSLTTVVGLAGVAQQALVQVNERSSGRPATLSITAYGSDGTQPDSADTEHVWSRALSRYDVTFASRIIQATRTVQFADGALPVQLQAVDQPYGAMHRVKLDEGAWFSKTDADRLAPAVIVNEVFFRRLGSPALATHPTTTLLGEQRSTAVIVGVYPSATWDTNPAMYMLADAYRRLPAVTAPVDSGVGQPDQMQYEMWVPPAVSGRLSVDLKGMFQSALGGQMQVDVNRQDYAANGDDPYLPVKLVVGGVAVLVLLLGALGLVNIALVTVRQRIREIGVRRSFGATAGRVFFAVMMESVVATMAAGVVGVLAAILIVKNPWLEGLIGQGLVTEFPPFPVDAALLGLGAATAVGALAGLLPALVAVRVKVIDAIRY
jgi:putative ABC transport system permease protein